MIHYLAVSKDGIKHRDISISNLMCRRLEDGKIQGVLNDWDVASTSHTESDSDHTNMRTGTMPFMSIDLHQHPPPVHMERFEYESLFYVLYWICLSYSDGNSFLGRRGIVLSLTGLDGIPLITMKFTMLKLVYNVTERSSKMSTSSRKCIDLWSKLGWCVFRSNLTRGTMRSIGPRPQVNNLKRNLMIIL